MTLTIYRELEQGSQRWIDARCGILTASVVGKLLTPTLKVAENDTSRGLIETLTAERISGRVDFIFPSADMQRGTMDEPLAKDVYRQHFAPVAEVGFMVRDFGSFKIGYSPDGLIADDGLLEIKSRRPRIQVSTILSGAIPRANLAQLFTGLLVSGREWIDFVSYSGGLPLWTKRVYRDQEWFAAILSAAEKFEAESAALASKYAVAIKGLPPTEYVDHFADEVMNIG